MSPSGLCHAGGCSNSVVSRLGGPIPDAVTAQLDIAQSFSAEPIPELSIVIPAHNEASSLRETLAALRQSVRAVHEIIIINDASTDSCCDFLRRGLEPFENVTLIDLPERSGVAYARNLGATRATAPILVAMDAHCIPHEGWLEQLLEALEKPSIGIVAPQISSIECPSATTFGLTIGDRELGVNWLHQQSNQPYPVPLTGCACMVMKREFFEWLGRFDAMRSYGMEDVEICIRCWLAGYSIMMVPGAQVGHWFKKNPFPVNWHDYLYNRLRTAVIHFGGQQLEAILHQLQTKPEFANALSSLLASDVWERRCFVRKNRKHDADWFCRKFEIAL